MIIVTNRHLCRGDFLERIERLAALRPSGILLREKDLSLEEYILLAQACGKICRENSVPMILSHFPDAADITGNPYLQLSYPLFIELPYLAKKLCCGVSVHSLCEAKAAEKAGAKYLIAGHIFETDCKPGIRPRGLSFLRELCSSVRLPVYAIGGIRADNFCQVFCAGAKDFCVMSLMMSCACPEKIYRKFQMKKPR